MATKTSVKGKTGQVSRSKRSTTASRQVRLVPEPLPARALQLLTLSSGILLLLAVFVGLRWGITLIGVVVFASAWPPFRRDVDKLIVGKSRGSEADQAATIRMLAGIGISLLALLGVFGF